MTGTVGLVKLTSDPGSTSDALGLFLLVAAIAMLIPAAAGSGKLIPCVVLATNALGFATTGLYELTASPTWQDIAGIAGLHNLDDQLGRIEREAGVREQL